MSADVVVADEANSKPKRLHWLLALLAVVIAVYTYWAFAANARPHMGAITAVTELNSGLEFRARVDTGAKYCSINCTEIDIPEGDPLAHIGTPIRIRLENSKGESAWVEAPLADYGGIRAGGRTSERYMVYLPLRVEGVEATVLVTLNDRRNMRSSFLVGRNLLHDRFVVDVRRNADDTP